MKRTFSLVAAASLLPLISMINEPVPGENSPVRLTVPRITLNQGMAGASGKQKENFSPDSLQHSSWYSDVLQHIEASEYQFKWEEKYKSYSTPNRKNNLRFFYDEKGFIVEPARTKIPLMKEEPGQTLSASQYKHIPNWKISFELDSKLIKDGCWKVNKNKAEYTTDKLTVQYINSKEGMRQNFIVPAPLTGNDELQIDFSVQTKLKTYLHGNQLQFIHPKTGHVMNYDGLKVWDAAGKELKAELQKTGTGYCINVDAKDAAYPVTIDPLSSAPDKILNDANQAGAQFGTSVASAGDVNGDGYSDMIIGAPNYDDNNADEGHAFVYYGSIAGLSSTANSILDGADQADALFGYSVSSAGDVNGDGYSDVIIGAPFYDDGGNNNEGRAFVYYGSAAGLSALPNSMPDDADQANARFGTSVALTGDVNRDGYSDIIIGAPLYDDGGNNNEGRAFVYYGSAARLSASPGSTLDDADQGGAQFGTSVASAGDVNADGYSDIVIGAPFYGPSGEGSPPEGRTYIYYGSPAGLPASQNVTLSISNQGGIRFGQSVSTAGDVNGDGYSDVVIGAPFYDNGANISEGRAYVYYGSAAGLQLNPASLSLTTSQSSAFFGLSVACAGDVNGDGYSDIVVSAPGYIDNGNVFEGRVFVYYGSALSTGIGFMPDRTLGDANQANAFFGWSVASAGDVNGDGLSDVIVGARGFDDGANTDEGNCFIYHGSAAGLSAEPFEIENNGLQYQSYYGISLSSAGDINGDGYSDILIGAYSYTDDFTDEGLVFVKYGSSSGFIQGVESLSEANQGFAYFGFSVAAAGDVNADGYADVIAGAFQYDNESTNEGAAFLYYGSPAGIKTIPPAILEPANQQDANFGLSVASAGDVNGDGYSDVIIGAPNYNGSNTDEGRVYIYHGSATGISSSPAISFSDAGQGAAGFGYSVASAGDVNGDGFSDVIIGASGFDDGANTNEGRVFIHHGSVTGINAVAAGVLDDANQADAAFGYSVASAGDVNGDGYSDVIIGAPFYNDDFNDEGVAYLHYGSSAGLSLPANRTLNNANQAGSLFGYSVASAGDVNGDGYSDVLVGAPLYDEPALANTGRAYAYYGSVTGIPAAPDVTFDSADEAGEQFGQSVSSAGDMNGDGYSDVIIGAPLFDGTPALADEGRYFRYTGGVNETQAGLLNKRNNVRLYNTDLTTPVNRTNFGLSSFGTGLFSRSFLGRQHGKMVWETRVSYAAFSGIPITNSVSFTAEQTSFTDLSNGVELKNLVAKVPGARYTRIRARVKYALATAITGQVYGPWRSILSPVEGNNLAVLPVELLSFKASWIQKGKTATIDFTTDKEDGTTCRFDIEKSTDGINFITIAGLPATNAPGIQRYHYVDNNATAGKQYYRLKIKDKDGGVKYSNIALLQHSGTTEIIAFPNPATDLLQLELNKNYDKLDIAVLNSAGQLVKRLNNLAANNRLIKIPVSELSPGVYWLQLQIGTDKQVLQFVKQ
ncbi:MAG: FG-GAP repeat protein [Chitinophagaceae bacterium]|nr:FG-GAP repeat protein [Chitinophagaceae bacterium]